MPREKPEPYTKEMLEAVIASLRGETIRLEAVKEYMTSAEIESLEIGSSLSLRKKVLPLLASFTKAAEEALTNYRLNTK